MLLIAIKLKAFDMLTYSQSSVRLLDTNHK